MGVDLQNHRSRPGKVEADDERDEPDATLPQRPSDRPR